MLAIEKSAGESAGPRRLCCRRSDLTPRAPLPTTRRLASRISRGFAPMPHAELAKTIDEAFEHREHVGPATKGPMREAVEAALDLLDRGDRKSTRLNSSHLGIS